VTIASVSQDTIRVDVAFYDEVEKERLLRYPTGSVMKELVKRPIDVPTSEFLSYFLFHRRRPGMLGYQSPAAIGKKLDVALSILDAGIEFNGHSICTAEGVLQQLTEISEHTGEAIGLSVVSRIHGLTEADWTPIEERRGRGASPTFDFQLASNGQHFVQVENKGSSVIDNRILADAIRAQKRRISEKKSKLRELGEKGSDPYPARLRYGTITAVDRRKDGNARCLLTDPPPGEIDDNPRRFRLLRRMRFLRDWISFVSVRSQLASALSTRVADFEAMRDPFELDRVPLRKGNGERFEFVPSNIVRPHSSFFANKSRVTDGPAGGVVLQLSTRELFLAGIREELVTIASDQSFEGIAAYRAPYGDAGQNCGMRVQQGSFPVPTSACLGPQSSQRIGQLFGDTVERQYSLQPCGLGVWSAGASARVGPT
jgi:hypothetical protein